MLDLDKEELLFLRSLLIPDINVLISWLRVAPDAEERARLLRIKSLREGVYFKVEAGLADLRSREGVDNSPSEV